MWPFFFIDLDGFKNVNDTWGHAVGDQLLAEVARRMSVLLRKTDTLARFGGDEFVAAMGNLRNKDTAQELASKLIEEISRPFIFNGTNIKVGASVGISYYPDDAKDLDSLLKLADQAMYDAKQSGKNCISTMDDDSKTQNL